MAMRATEGIVLLLNDSSKQMALLLETKSHGEGFIITEKNEWEVGP